MKIVVIGDTHDNIANIKHVIGFAKKINAGAIIHTGDWNHINSVETVLSYKIPLYSVLGNADIDPNFDKFLKEKCKDYDPDFLEVKIDNFRIGVIHNSIKYKQPFSNLDIVFTGHYHTQKAWEVTDFETNFRIKMIRPGSLEHDINFAVFDTLTKSVELINENIDK